MKLNRPGLEISLKTSSLLGFKPGEFDHRLSAANKVEDKLPTLRPTRPPRSRKIEARKGSRLCSCRDSGDTIVGLLESRCAGETNKDAARPIFCEERYDCRNMEDKLAFSLERRESEKLGARASLIAYAGSGRLKVDISSR